MQNKIYYIYHIPGVKIGCTKDIVARFRHYDYSDYEILEKHNDIKLASKREIELQKEYGYKIDTVPYWKVIETYHPTKEGRIKNGKLASSRYSKQNGLNAVKSGQWDTIKHLGSEVQKKEILAYDAKTNEFIGEYESLAETAKELNCSISKICQVARGQRNTHKGYTFKYKE